MKDIPIIDCEGYYASHWGLTDLYPENEKLLRDWLASGEDFATTWWSSKKELVSAKYEAEGDTITVSVSQSIDDLWFSSDLIMDAIWELGLDWEDPSEEELDAIREEASEFAIDDGHTASICIPRDSSFETVMTTTLKAWGNTDSVLQQGYETLKTIVKGYYEYFNTMED